MAVSVRDVAEAAGVSVGTVSNVLNRPDKVSAETVARVHRAIDLLGFVRNDAARQLRAGRSRSIGLVVLDMRNPFFTEVARGAEERASTDDLTVLMANSDEKQDREDRHVELFEEQRVFGMLVTPVYDSVPKLRAVRDRGTPTVLVDRESRDGSFASVAVDDLAGGTLAASHLLDVGRRRLMFVGGPVSIRQVADRLEGAQGAVAAHGGASLEFVGTRALT
ncbi:MAG: LacI family transcriptional regulator, partial [Microbacterium sp. SCN 71-21]